MLERNFIQPRPVHILTTSSCKIRFNIIPNIDKIRSAVVSCVKVKMVTLVR
jgi:hypothetical protein